MLKKIIPVFIILLMNISQVFASPISDIAKNVYTSVPSPTVSSIGGEWAVIGLVKSGENISDEFYKSYCNNVKQQLLKNDGILSSSKNTEYARVVLALSAIGTNSENIAGYNLLTPLTDTNKTMRQGINGAIWSLIALDCKNFETVSDEISNKYLDLILSAQAPDGGWSLTSDVSDADTTAMALCALAKYRHLSDVSSAIDNAIKFLSDSQLPSGGFLSQNEENCESAAQVIIALSSLGISPNDERFTKNANVYDNLMTFFDGNGGFFHTKNADKTNQMATEQALCAISAINSDTPLYDMTLTPNIDFSGDSAIRKTFSDIESHPTKFQIESLASRGIISGIDENNFLPDANMTRAEFSSVITRGLNISPIHEKIFDDVTEEKWYFGFIAAAYKNNIISGISEHEFNPSGLITKEEAAMMLFRSAEYLGKSTEYNENVLFEFDDFDSVAPWAKGALAFCFEHSILEDDDIYIHPQTPVTRAEIALMIYNLLM